MSWGLVEGNEAGEGSGCPRIPAWKGGPSGLRWVRGCRFFWSSVAFLFFDDYSVASVRGLSDSTWHSPFNACETNSVEFGNNSQFSLYLIPEQPLTNGTGWALCRAQTFSHAQVLPRKYETGRSGGCRSDWLNIYRNVFSAPGRARSVQQRQ